MLVSNLIKRCAERRELERAEYIYALSILLKEHRLLLQWVVKRSYLEIEKATLSYAQSSWKAPSKPLSVVCGSIRGARDWLDLLAR